MKMFSIFRSAFLAILLLACSAWAYADTRLEFRGEEAKKLYNYLTGTAVQAEGAAGHQYRIGKALTCRYAAADMSDIHGKHISQEDPRRYACSMKVDHEGFVSVNGTF